ncbi:hypothetical protein B0H14DRAFT_2622548 [Mycena olivaceomarginata]|nr:hypothetical protein B0H14DRAFT_2622548 [Mycena olivaceomarginata]
MSPPMPRTAGGFTLDIPPRSHTAAPGCRTSTIPDVFSSHDVSESFSPAGAAQTRCAADLSIPPARQPQSIHYPGFDVFMDNTRNDHTTDEAFDAETTNILAPGRDQEQEKENIGRGIP